MGKFGRRLRRACRAASLAELWGSREGVMRRGGAASAGAAAAGAAAGAAAVGLGRGVLVERGRRVWGARSGFCAGARGRGSSVRVRGLEAGLRN